jgi:hypothetical protein
LSASGKAFELKILPPPNRSEPVPGQRKSVASGVNPIFNYARPDCVQVAKFFLARRIADRSLKHPYQNQRHIKHGIAASAGPSSSRMFSAKSFASASPVADC